MPNNKRQIALIFLVAAISGYGTGFTVGDRAASTAHTQAWASIGQYAGLLKDAVAMSGENAKRQTALVSQLQALLTKDQGGHAQNTATPAPKTGQCDHVDLDSVKMSLSDMHSDDFGNRKRALTALAMLGDASLRQDIGQVISDTSEAPALRRELIKATDWQGYGKELATLLADSSPEIKNTAIQAAKNTPFSDGEKQSLEEKLLETLVSDPDDGTKIEVLNYFADTGGAEKLNEAISALPIDQRNPEVQKHIDFLAAPSLLREPG